MALRSKSALTTAKARESLAEVINRAAYGKERVMLTRRGRALAAVVPIEDIALLESIEDGADPAEIRRRLAQWERGARPAIGLAEIAKRYGIDLPEPND